MAVLSKVDELIRLLEDVKYRHKYRASTDRYKAELQKTYEDWYKELAGDLSKEESEAKRGRLTDAALLVLLMELKRLGRERLEEAYMQSIEAVDITPEMVDEMELIIASNDEYLEDSLIPALGERIEKNVTPEIWFAGLTAILGTFTGFSARVGLYAGAYWDAIWKGAAKQQVVQGREDWQILWLKDPRARHCCPAGTMVSTPNGQVEIEDVHVGDYVTTKNGVKQVTEIHSREFTGDLCEIRAGQLIRCTPEHPFWTHRGWVQAQWLRESDALELEDGWHCAKIYSLGYSGVQVYNLEVEDVHHYFANGFLVHNCDTCLANAGAYLHYDAMLVATGGVTPNDGTLCQPNCRCELLTRSGPEMEWVVMGSGGVTESMREGGPGSGHHGHAGRLGQRGGSISGKGYGDIKSEVRYTPLADEQTTELMNWKGTRGVMAQIIVNLAKEGKPHMLLRDVGGEIVSIATFTIQNENHPLRADRVTEQVGSGKLLYIDWLATKRSGYGRISLDKLRDHAVEVGAKGMYLYSTPDARGFYEKLGFHRGDFGGYYLYGNELTKHSLLESFHLMGEEPADGIFAIVPEEWDKLLSEGGPGSGHHGHAGRPGAVGGSMSGASAKKIRLTRHAFNRTKERTGFGPVRRALKALSRMEVPDEDWHTELYRSRGQLAGYLQGFDGRVKTVLGAWYKKGNLRGEEITWKR